MKNTLFSLFFTFFSLSLSGQTSISVGRLLEYNDNGSLRYTTLGALKQYSKRSDIGVDFGFASFIYPLYLTEYNFMSQVTYNYYLSEKKRRAFLGVKLKSDLIRTKYAFNVFGSVSNAGFSSSFRTDFGISAGFKLKLYKWIEFLTTFSEIISAIYYPSGFDELFFGASIDLKLIYKLKESTKK